jgi:glyoxylase-like metal-dependent hydrolase (beta-lactamase superfamily II)
MQVHLFNTGFFRLDGGAMFGVVPRTIWEKHNPPDQLNRCNWALRCLLIETENQLVLIDNGIGDKLPDTFLKHYELSNTNHLNFLLKKLGIENKDITHNILTHLHFDHCGGGTFLNQKNLPQTSFPNANYWIHSGQWNWAIKPNPREKASFLSQNIEPIVQSEQIHFLDQEDIKLAEMEFFFVDGHTEKQAIPLIKYKNKTLVFVADLLPSVAHIPIPYVMAYDARPLVSMDEKSEFLKKAADNEWIIILQHDPFNECCTVQHSEKGVKLNQTFKFSDI